MSSFQDILPGSRTHGQPAPNGLDPRSQRARIEAAFRKRDVGFGAGFCCIPVVWALAAAYYFLLPPVYTSRWSMIVPASNSGSSITLESVGQASNMPGQPFGTVTLSPKAIYREIITSDQVRKVAADAVGEEPEKFGRVRVRLIDETSLLMLQIDGRRAQEAQAKGRALIGAFEAQLDVLRRDEFDKRAVLMRENLRIYQANLDKSRERIAEFQRASGLLSMNQFTEA